jgi:amino-acid N-acetyltransferase
MSENPIIRIAEAGDAEAIYRLLKYYSDQGRILERSKDEIESIINHFHIAEINGEIIGIISCYDYEERLKEIRSLAVAPDMYHQGIGSMLLNYLIRKLSTAEGVKIFALSYVPEFFKKNGFVEVPKETLPEKIWKDCSTCTHRDTCGETAIVFAGRV